MKKSNSTGGISIGSSSLILIFVVLCMTVFAVLALMSANADKKLSDKSAEAVSAYYIADLSATDKINLISEELKTNNAEAVLQLAEVDYRADGNRYEFSFDTKIDSRRTLHTAAVINDGIVTVTEWKTVTETADYDSNSTGMWDGTFDFAEYAE